MNKSVEVTGMKLKAQAEKGILINEMAGPGSGTWSEAALAGQEDPIALRPASTVDLSSWWHANSRLTSLEAGISSSGTVESANTVDLGSGTYYSDISTVNTSGSVTDASADVNAMRTVYFKDGTGSGTGVYDDGEGFYVQYIYYLKSSSNEDLTVPANKLAAKVTATLQGSGSGTSAQDLDKALRVGIKVGSDTRATIFAPITGYTASYYVTGGVGGTSATEVTPIAANTDAPINEAAVILPKVTNNGIPVYVYVWFEGEDAACKSDNLAETLNAYQIDITFTDTALGTD